MENLFPNLEIKEMINLQTYFNEFDESRVRLVTEFVNDLANYKAYNVFNPWGDADLELDSSEEAPLQRRENLIAYLLPRLGHSSTIVVAEAVGYQGGRFTGIAITCERMLLGHHKQIEGTMICPVPLHRTSSTTSKLLKGIQREKGLNEPTDTVVWGAIKEANIDPYTVLLWNIFPFHPHKENEPLTNRTPTEQEQAVGWLYTKRLLELNEQLHEPLCVTECSDRNVEGQAKQRTARNATEKGPLILGVGQKSAETMSRFGISITPLRHPANGGANLYRKGFKECLR